MDALTAVNTRQTPQSRQADPRQVPNNAGGYGFQVDDEVRVNRFLTIGTDGGTYYTSERDLTQDNAEVILRAARERGAWLIERIVEVSTTGRAPRQNPAIFALAACSALPEDDATRSAALAAIPTVCRTGTHLFLYTKYVQQFRGWGAGLRRGLGRWFTDKDAVQLAYQMIKYRQREGWTQRDLLRSAHPIITDPARKALFNWTINGNVEVSRAPGGELRPVGATIADLPALVGAFEQAQAATDVGTWVGLIQSSSLSWEMLPDAALSKPEVWRALIARGMPQTALMRQLPRLTRLGVLEGDTLTTVVSQLRNADKLANARVHPINVLVAQRTYASGRSIRGESTWTPKRQIVDALDGAFYAAFGAVEPAGKRTLLALDVSGSMGGPVSGLPISCREASAALGLVTMATEPECDVVGFTAARGGRNPWVGGGTTITELAISPRQRLDDAVRAVSELPFGGTDCALPMVWAEQQGKSYDTFVILTDNETWAGRLHPHQALNVYRQRTSIDAKLVVVGMTATDFSIADPKDLGMLDVAGLDSAVPQLIGDFSRGSV